MRQPSPEPTPRPVALVIGAAGHHGRAIAEALTAAGWAIAGLDLIEPTTELPLVGDATEAHVVRDAVAQAEHALGPISLLALAADHTEDLAFADISPASWGAMLNLYLRTAVNASRAVLPGMLERGTGSIVAITPASALNGTGAPHHAAAASSVIGFVKALAREVGPQGVLVNAVAPGPINTAMTDKMTDEWKSAKAAELPLGRFGEADEVAPTVVLLASDPGGNLYVGQTLGPNSGDVMP